ncbi:MAG: tRNA pseudouridine(55) synthase TruB [Ignavibacteriaceae bacterium]|nr:tRNA pseudouridine(55) synthase TruB [Ignavibacteriaceae bacterium]
MKMMIKKGTTDLKAFDFAAGEIILIDKPLNWTSFDVVAKVRKLVNVAKVGHAGTLDPMATGLLIICTGKKTKEVLSFQDLDKTYTGTILLGKKSKSMDLETDLVGSFDVSSIKDEEIFAARDKFVGKIQQVPPIYSAIKFKGKSLYNFARKGKSVKLEPREVAVYMFEILSIKKPNIDFRIKCSKGTYIRSIANDIGDTIGCGAVLSALRRTAIGDYNVHDALTMEEFKYLAQQPQLSNKLELETSVQ